MVERTIWWFGGKSTEVRCREVRGGILILVMLAGFFEVVVWVGVGVGEESSWGSLGRMA